MAQRPIGVCHSACEADREKKKKKSANEMKRCLFAVYLSGDTFGGRADADAGADACLRAAVSRGKGGGG